jgi:hypothetical protein
MSFRSTGVLCLSAAIGFCVACGGSGSGTNTPPPPVPVSISVQPASVNALVGSTVTFAPTVSGSDNTQVSFKVDEGNNGGVIVANGEYTAPALPGTYHVTVTSVADSTKTARATVTVSDYQNRSDASVNAPALARHGHLALTLDDDSVLLLGGAGDDARMAERYNPRTGIFTATARMNATRGGFAGVTLISGRPLVLGGDAGTPSSPALLRSTELYDPFVGPFSPSGDMVMPRAFHEATVLQGGNVLVTGGMTNDGLVHTTNTAEIYDRRTGTFTLAGPMVYSRQNHTATMLQDGRVLIVGGRSNSCTTRLCNETDTLATAELYDPLTGAFTPAGTMQTARMWHSATPLVDGRVLIAGGFRTGSDDRSVNTYEIFDPVTGVFNKSIPMQLGRNRHTATVLSNGKVLVAGGYSDFPDETDRTEIFDPSLDTVREGGILQTPRKFHSATLLPNGEVLIVGGSLFTSLRSAEFYK